MTVLSPMTEQFYQQFYDVMSAHYAEENVTSGRWPKENALERSRNEMAQLLPEGITTPDHYLFEIKADDEGETVGYIWLATTERQGERTAFVYEVTVLDAFRRQGHARAAFLQLEDKVRALGLGSIGLNVFYNNAGAQALYRSLGYAPTNMTMVKNLNAN